MDGMAILDTFFWIMGVISGGFLAWGGWLCLRDLAEDRARRAARKAQAEAHWPHRARLS
jgi:threonine/homoserine/homoserine lactone efflux protein